MTEFRVTLTFQFPAWDEINGLDFFVIAPTKAKAIEAARRAARRDGHIPATGKGRSSFRAEVA